MELANIYDKVAPTYDLLDFPFEIFFYQKMRAKYLTSIANSNILEIGMGTGKNLPFYRRTNVVTALEPSVKMRAQAQQRIETCRANIEVITTNLQEFSTLKKYDYIVATFVLYLQSDLEYLIEKLENLLTENGRLIVFEYRVSDNPFIAKIFKTISPITQYLYGLDFNTIETINHLSKGFELLSYENYWKDILFASVWKKS